MSKCSCYHARTIVTYDDILRGIKQPVKVGDIEGVCYGTKEMDECFCNGDPLKCTFYPEKRAQAEKELTKNELEEQILHKIRHDYELVKLFNKYIELVGGD